MLYNVSYIFFNIDFIIIDFNMKLVYFLKIFESVKVREYL